MYICVCKCLLQNNIAGVPSSRATFGFPQCCASTCARSSCTRHASCVDSKPKIKIPTSASLPKRRGFGHVCLGLVHVGCIPQCSRPQHTSAFVWVFFCAYARVLLMISAALDVHVTHTQHIHTLTYTHTHIHTHHTIMSFSQDSSFTTSVSKLVRNIRITWTNHLLRVRSTILCSFALFEFVLSCVCAHVCIRIYFCFV